MADTGAPAALFGIGADVKDLIKVRDAIRDSLSGVRAEISDIQSQIYSDQARALQASNDAEKAAAAQRIAINKQALLQQRADASAYMADIQRLSQQIPRQPLRVSLEGIDEKAIEILRDEFGTLLGPLNGVTGRISSIISLMKIMSQAGKESTEAVAAGARGVQLSNIGAAAATSVLSEAQAKTSTVAKAAGAEVGAAGEKVREFGRTAEVTAAQMEVTDTVTKKLGISTGEAAAGAEEAGGGFAILGEGVTAFLGPAAIALSILAAVTGALFKAGKDTAELAKQYTELGERIGLTAQQVQGLSSLAAVSGQSTEGIITALTRFSFTLTGRGKGDAAGVAGAANAAQSSVELLVGSVKNSDGTFLPAIEILKRLADVFKGMPDGMEKSALASQLFGYRIGSELIPALNKGSAGIQDLLDQANKFGADLTGQAQKMTAWDTEVDKLSKSWQGLEQVIGDSGVFTLATEAIGKLAEAIRLLNVAFNSHKGEESQDIYAQLAAGLSKANATGDQTLTDGSKAIVDKISKALQQEIHEQENPWSTLFGRTIRAALASVTFGGSLRNAFPQIDLLPSDVRARTEAALADILQQTAGITDETEKQRIQKELLIKLTNDLVAAGVLQQKTEAEITDELTKQINAGNAAALLQGGIEEIQKYKKEALGAQLEIDKLNEKTGMLGTNIKTPESAKQLRADLEDLKKTVESVTTLKTPDQLKTGEKLSDDQVKALLDAKNKIGADVLALQLQRAELDKVLKNPSTSAADKADAQKQAADIDATLKVATALSQYKEKASELAEATTKAREHAIELGKEWTNVGKEITDAIDKAIESAIKLGTGADEVHNLDTTLAKTTAAVDTYGAQLEKAASKSKGGADAAKSLTGAWLGVRDAQTAITTENQRYEISASQLNTTITALKASQSDSNLTALQTSEIQGRVDEATLKLKTNEAEHKDIVDGLVDSLRAQYQQFENSFNGLQQLVKVDDAAVAAGKNFKEQVEKQAQAFTGLTEAQVKAVVQAQATAKAQQELLTKSAELTVRLKEQGDELDHVGERELNLSERVSRTISDIQEQASVISQVRAQLNSGTLGTQDYVDKQELLSTETRKQIASAKELVAEQEELKKSTLNLANVWKDATDALEGFGISLPKQLAKVTQTITAIQHLTQIIERYTQAQKAQNDAEAKAGEKIPTKQGSGVQGFLHALTGGSDNTAPDAAQSPFVKAVDSQTTATITLRASTDKLNETEQQSIAAIQANTAAQASGGSGSPVGDLTGSSQSPLGDLGGGPSATGFGSDAGQPLAGIPGVPNSSSTVNIAPPGGGAAGESGAAGAGGGLLGALGPIAGGAGAGASLFGSLEGNKQGKIGGALLGGAAGGAFAASEGLLGPLAAAGPIGIAVAAAVGVVTLIVGAFIAHFDAETAKIAKRIKDTFDATIKAFQDGAISLGVTLNDVNAQIASSVDQLAGKSGHGNTQLVALLQQMYPQLAQLKAQQQQVISNFNVDLGTLRFPQGIQDTIKSIQDLNAQLKDFINAGGDANQAAEFLARSLAAVQQSTQTDLLNTEQQTVSLLQQQLQLRQQAAQVIHDEAQQEQQILNQGVTDKNRSVAQNEALQILQLRQARDLQLKQINEQIAANQAQVGNAQQIFGLTLNENDLLQKQLSIQEQLTAVTDQQTVAQENILAALKQIQPGGTQVDLNAILQAVGGAASVPGLAALPGTPASQPFDSSAFLAAVSSLTNGIHDLSNFLGGSQNLGSSLTQQQEQGFLDYLQNLGDNTIGPQTQAVLAQIMQQELQNQTLAQNQLAGGSSPDLGATGLGFGPTGLGVNVANAQTVSNQLVAAAQSGASAIATAGSPPFQTSTSVSDALNSTSIVPVAIVGGNFTASGPVGESGGLGLSPIISTNFTGTPAPAQAPFTTTAAPAQGGGAGIAEALGYTQYGTDSAGAPVYIDGNTGQLYNSLGEPLSPSTQTSPLLSGIPGSTGITGPTSTSTSVSTSSGAPAGAGSVSESFTAPFLPMIQAVSSLVSEGLPTPTVVCPGETPPLYPPGSGPTPAGGVNGPTPARPQVPGLAAAAAANPDIASGSILASPDFNLDNLTQTLNLAKASQAGSITIGGITVQVSGTTNMNQSQLTESVTQAMNNAFNELRARRGIGLVTT